MNRNPEGVGDEKLDDDFGYQEGMQAKGRTHGRRPEVAGRSERKGPAMSSPGTDPAMSPGTAPATESIPHIRSTHPTSQVQTPEGGESFHCRWKKIHSLQGTRRTWAGTEDFGSVIPSSVEKGSSRGITTCSGRVVRKPARYTDPGV